MQNWKRYAMAAVFVVLSSGPVAGCNIDISGCVADAIANIATGNSACGSCGGCGDCGACDCGSCDCDCGACDCSCADCGDCALQPIRDQNGRNQGFNWAHNEARIPNSIQVRLTDSGLDYINSQLPSLISTVLPPGGIDLSDQGINGSIRIELRNPSMQGLQQGSCSNNAVVGQKDCIRLQIGLYARTCDKTGGCTQGENIPVTVPDVPILGSLTCNLNVDLARAGGQFQSLPIRADIALPAETHGPRQKYSHPVLLDATVTNVNALEGSDVIVNCPNQTGLSPVAAAGLAIGGAIADGVSVSCSCDCSGIACAGCPFSNWWNCSINPSGLVTNTINELRNDLNNIIDYQERKLVQFCQVVQNQIDCPTGTAYVDSNGNEPGTAGTCQLVAGSQAQCPPGTSYQGGRCWFVKPGGSVNTAGDRLRAYCMDMLLGIEGRMDMGPALASVSPGIESVVDLLVAAFGNAQVPSNAVGGYNINIAGGVEHIAPSLLGYLRDLPHNPCVPETAPADVPGLPTIPLASAVRGNTYPDFTGQQENPYEIGVGVAEAFVQYAVWKLWDSGLMCLHVGSSLDPQLGVGLLAPLVFQGGSAGQFLFPYSLDVGADPAAERTFLALSLRPGRAPVTSMDMIPDPADENDMVFHVEILFEDLNLDFSFWTNDRYTRVGTVNTGLLVALDLDLEIKADGTTELAIGLSQVDFIGARWTDAPLINAVDRGDVTPTRTMIELALDGIGGAVKQFAGGLLPRIDIETLINANLAVPGQNGGPAMPLPFEIDITEDTLQVFTQGAPCSGAPYDSGTSADTCDYAFGGVFLKLIPSGGAHGFTHTVETSVQVTRVEMPEDLSAFRRETLGEGALPKVEIAMSATGPEGADFEYSYRTSFGAWSEWSRSPYAIIENDPSLTLQTEQTVFARARVVGQPLSMDTSSATDTFVIDATPPMLEVVQLPSGDAQLQAYDWISGPEAMEFRVREPGEAWTAWARLGTAVKDLGDIDPASEVEVRDAEGNVGSNTAALRGRPDPNAASSCGSCATAGSQRDLSPLAAFSTLAVLGMVVARRRRRRA